MQKVTLLVTMFMVLAGAAIVQAEDYRLQIGSNVLDVARMFISTGTATGDFRSAASIYAKYAITDNFRLVASTTYKSDALAWADHTDLYVVNYWTHTGGLEFSPFGSSGLYARASAMYLYFQGIYKPSDNIHRQHIYQNEFGVQFALGWEFHLGGGFVTIEQYTDLDTFKGFYWSPLNFNLLAGFRM